MLSIEDDPAKQMSKRRTFNNFQNYSNLKIAEIFSNIWNYQILFLILKLTGH